VASVPNTSGPDICQKLSGRWRLPSQLADSRGDIHSHVGKPVVLWHIRQVFGEVSHLQYGKLGLGMRLSA
jgi:hypothetical protein